MDQRAAELQTRLSTVAGLGNLVNAMRGLSAARSQRARALIEGVNAYADTVAAAMGQLLALLPTTESAATTSAAQALWLVFGAEQGFNGGFTEQVLAGLPKEAKSARVIVLGTQALRVARARGLSPQAHAPLVAHAQAAVDASERVHQVLLEALRQAPASSVELLFNELEGSSRYAVRQHRLLPLDLNRLRGPTRQPPLVHQPPAQLLEALVGEYMTARLAQAVLHSHATENLSRLQAMAAAHENIGRMTQNLQGEELRWRQEAVTAEVLELAAGLRSMSADESKNGGA
jgi:F-type H+-transporting ATPase subunit gamma